MVARPLVARRCWLAACLMAFTALTPELARAEPQVLRGTVVSAAAGKLVVKDSAGSEKSFTVEAGASVLVHGKPAKLEDLQQTMLISVTSDEKGKVLAVATVDKHKRSVELAFVRP